jgi:hypothetical protein
MIMALYAALLYYPEGQDWTSADVMGEHGRFLSAPGIREAYRAGAALYPVSAATTITVVGGQGGDVMITDGPYAEAKEVLAGFLLLEAADLDEAMRWAAQIPTAWRGKVELRPVLLSRSYVA